MHFKKQTSPKVLLQKVYARIRLILYFKTKFYRKYVAAKFRPRTVLTFPHKPHPKTIMYKLCHLLGYRITRNTDKEADLVINWEDCTFRRSYEVLDQLNKRQPVLNIGCKDISKRRVDEVHKAVFGYNLTINPLTYQGPCVKKSNKNAAHDGVIIQCPVAKLDEESVYQIVVNNKTNGDFIEDIRVPVFGDNIPFCYRKYRPVQHRFSNENAYARLCERDDVLSTVEIGLLLQFSRRMRLDYGELDVLRDLDTGKLYVVDVNITPFGPPNHLNGRDVGVALERLSEAFAAFVASCTHSH